MKLRIQKKVIIELDYQEYLNIRGALMDAGAVCDIPEKARAYDKILNDLDLAHARVGDET